MAQILVIDGQGGRIGCQIIQELISRKTDADILALGTNSCATSAMLKAGASAGASGENPIIVNAPRADIIIGPVGIIASNSLLGEITPRMAEAISDSKAEKVLIPVNRCKIIVAGTQSMKLGEYIQDAVNAVGKLLKK